MKTTGGSLAVSPAISIPVGRIDEAQGLGSGKTYGALTLIGTKELSWGSLHANLGFSKEKFREASNSSDAADASVAAVVNLGPQFLTTLEAGMGSSDTAGISAQGRFAEAGIVYMPDDDFEVGVGVIRYRERSGGATAYASELTTGVTWRFK